MNSLLLISIISLYSYHLSGVSSVVSHPHPDLLMGSKTCPNDTFCIWKNVGYVLNVYCNEFDRCECKHGFVRSIGEYSKRDDCNMYKCTKEADKCSLYWGEGSMCYLKYDEHSGYSDFYLNRCICPGELEYSPTKRMCTQPTSVKIGDKCDQLETDNDDDCPYNAFCMKGRCRCEVGYEPVNNYTCREIHCTSNDKCRGFFNNSDCTFDNRCDCALGYILNDNRTECIPRPRQDSCDASETCYKPTVCHQKKCQCPQGFIDSPDNLWDCEKMNCSVKMSICTIQDHYSYCDTGSGHCKCFHSLTQDKFQCMKPPTELKPVELKKPETSEVVYIVIAIGVGSIIVFVAAFMVYRFYPQILRLKDSFFDLF